jgi:hypothetical protein
MSRVNPVATQREHLFTANAHRCCVCKRHAVGFNLHHIDHDSSNTIDENLAVLCVEDHDRHHRPGVYQTHVNHLELGPAQIKNHKQSWETFFSEARQPAPKVIATLAAYGTYELIHSLQLVMQWPDERIEYKKSYHLLDGDLNNMTDAVFDELKQIGPNIKLALLNEPLPVEHCPYCGTGCSRTTKPAVVTRHTDLDWPTQSACSIYINPDMPSLAIVFSLREKELCAGSLHLCQGCALHYQSEEFDERIAVTSSPSIRAQATRIVKKILKEWSPAKVFIGTGDPDAPELIDGLHLPGCWEELSDSGS